VCHATYARGERFCPLDGGVVVDEGAAAPLIGTTLDDRYLIRRYIGRGGMGAVYEADHVGLDRRVAIKLIADADADRDQRARFRQEARAASKVIHSNVVQIFDIGVDEQGRDYLAMEYVEGRDLRQLTDVGPVEPARAIAIGKQVLTGLAAHRRATAGTERGPQCPRRRCVGSSARSFTSAFRSGGLAMWLSKPAAFALARSSGWA